MPLRLYLDGSDTNTAEQLEGSIQKTLGDFQLSERQVMIDALPEDVFDLAKKLPVQVRKQFVSMMEPWTTDHKILYNPKTRFIDYVVPGVIGLILQFITVTLMACTLARERESGTLFQLMVTSLRRREIVLGKVVPYLAISIVLILFIILLTAWHFQVQFNDPGALALICFLFLLCSLGNGVADFGHLAHPNPGDSILGLFSLAGVCSFRRICPARAAAAGHPLRLGIISAHPFLPRFPPGESVSCRAAILRGGSGHPLRGRGDHLRRRDLSAEADRAVMEPPPSAFARAPGQGGAWRIHRSCSRFTQRSGQQKS